MDLDQRAPLDPAAVEAAVRAAAASVGAPHLGRVEVVPTTASTSSDLVDAVRGPDGWLDWPDRSVLVADHQAAGRGRAGRTWTTPPGTAVTLSVLSRPGVPADRLGWVPLLGGLAVVLAVADVTGFRAVLKWPNDVLVAANDEVEGWGPFRKVAGVLGDLVATPQGIAVVLGLGVNVGQRAEELPVPSASSLALLTGAPVDRTALAAAVVARWVELDAAWRDAGGDAEAAGLAGRCAGTCVTLGRRVRVEVPGGAVVEGVAVGLADDGALRVETEQGVRSVHAGDVVHLRSVGDGA